MIVYISICAFAITLLGGIVAIRFKDRLHLFLGLSAGTVIGVAFFDLMKEALTLGQSHGYSITTILGVVVAGLLFFATIERSFGPHSHVHDDGHGHEHVVSPRGRFGALTLSIHSFFDGAAIGLAFQVSLAVGAVVAIAVLVHDFSDGINTASLVLKSGGNRKQALKWLLADAIAPVFGVLSTLFFTLPENILALFLAAFSGFFLYIGLSDLLPESYHSHPTRWTTFMTIVGVGAMFLIIRLIGA